MIFGFAAVKPVLIKEGVYRHLCSNQENSQRVPVCYGQELRLNLMFTVAAVAANVSAFPVGTILDTYGPRICGIIGSCLLTVGALFLAFAAHIPVLDAYITGYLCLALGGPFVYISSFHISNAIPARSGLVLATLNGAFDASSAVFLVFRLVNEKAGDSFSIQRFALAYLVTPLFIICAQILIMPSVSYKTVEELIQQAHVHIAAEASDRVDVNIQDRDERERQRNARRMHRQEVIDKIHGLLVESDREAASSIKALFDRPDIRSTTPSNHTKPEEHIGSVWGTLHGFPALHQIRSPWFILIALFTILQMLRLNYFIASIRQQYEYLFASTRLARRLNEVFDIILPLGGLLAIPFVGTIIDYSSSTFILGLLVTTATLIGILGCIPRSLIAGYTNIALFVIYRPFYYTAVSDYAAKVFGFQTFGKVYGLMICLAGLGNSAQAGLDTLTFRVFNHNPIPVNVVLTAVTALVGVVLVGFVWWRTRAMVISGADARIENGGMSFHENEDEFVGDREQEPLLYTSRRPRYGIASG